MLMIVYGGMGAGKVDTRVGCIRCCFGCKGHNKCQAQKVASNKKGKTRTLVLLLTQQKQNKVLLRSALSEKLERKLEVHAYSI